METLYRKVKGAEIWEGPGGKEGCQGLIFKDGRISTVDETFCLVFPVLTHFECDCVGEENISFSPTHLTFIGWGPVN